MDELAEMLVEASNKFDDLCQERHEAGAAEYGVLTFLENDVVRMMMEELADTSNYCRMQFMKLMILQDALSRDPEVKNLLRLGTNEADGKFKGTGEVGWESP